MATCDVNTLMQGAGGFNAVTVQPYQLSKLALLCQIAEKVGMTCDVATLMSDARCFCAVTSDPFKKVELQLLCEILAGVGTGGGTAPSITSFINNVNSVEIGSTVVSTKLDWVLAGGAITSQSINQGIGALAIALRTKTDLTNYTTDRTYTLTISDGTNTDNKSTSVSFKNKFYWGVSANTSLTDPQILALSSELTSSFLVTAKTMHPAGEYLYFAFPTSFGTPTISINGLVNTAWTLVTRNFTNASGYTTSYDIYRSNNLLTGTYVLSLST